MPLSWLRQEDFSAGAVRSTARHLIPESGAYSVENGLLDDDGSIYRRGGSEYVTSVSPAGGGLFWVWAGHFPAGPRTVFANAGGFNVLNDDGTIFWLGGSGVATPIRPAMVGGMLFIPGGAIYAGGRSLNYSIGTVTATQGSKTVTGAGTSWLSLEAGMLLRVAATGRYYVVASVDSNTQLTLADPFEAATVAGAAYALTGLGSAAAPYRTASIYATVAERLVTVEGSRIYFSEGRSETGVLRPHVFAATDYHELPEGARGLGAAAIRDLLVVFATDGVWTVNNMTYDLTDAAGNVQQQMQRTSQDVVLWGPAGVAEYRGALVVPAVDGVYLVDGVSQPVAVSDSITPLLVSYVRAGYLPGGATVFNNHYFLPVLNASNVVQDLLVCRLDRPTRSRGRTFFPWSWFRGHGGNVTALATQVSSTASRQPALLAAGTDGRVLRLTSVFAPSAARKSDADGTAHSLVVETRDYATGNGNANTVRRARLRYELEDAAADAPTITASYTPAGGSTVSLAGAAPVNAGRDKYTWLLQSATRYVRVRVQSAAPAARLVLRSVEIAVRPSGKDR